MAFRRTYYWTPKIQNGGEPPSWKSTWRHFFLQGRSDVDKMSQTGAEWHVDCSDMVEMETGSRIPIMADVCANWMAHHPRATFHTAWCCHLVNSMSWSQSHVPHCGVKEFHPPYWKLFLPYFIFRFPNAVWALASGGFRIVFDSLVCISSIMT